jgi:hypothetical protein
VRLDHTSIPSAISKAVHSIKLTGHQYMPGALLGTRDINI